LSKLYLCLNDTFVEKILFKNKTEELRELNKQHAAGSVEIPTELDVIMQSEAEFLIRDKYDNTSGAKELEDHIKEANKKNLLKMTGFDKKVRLNQMRRTWEFTRTGSMLHKLLETLVYIFISNTSVLLYLAFVYSMFQNSGLISLVYTFSMFGYALLEETRPRKSYWEWIRGYTLFVLILKFVMNLKITEFRSKGGQMEILWGYVKPGIYVYSELWRIFAYMLPEILITALLMLNEIHLKLLGLWYVIELDVESVQDGIARNMVKGDEEAVLRQKT